MRAINCSFKGVRLALLFQGLVLLCSFFALPRTVNAASDFGDCSSNSVISCGVESTAELQMKYQKPSVKPIFNYFGISDKDIEQLDSTARDGSITKNGTVVVNGKTVATHAVTAGRENIKGSKTVVIEHQTFYIRPTRVSFVSSPQKAFVVMKNNRFSYAVIKNCGNPVVAKAVPQSTAKKVVIKQPTTIINVASPPPQVVESAQITVNNPPPPPHKDAETLPNTGTKDPFFVGVVAATFSGFAHLIYKKRKYFNSFSD